MKAENKNEFLLIRNLLKPVRTVEKPEIKTDNEFENIKLRKTEPVVDKVEEKRLLSNAETQHDFSKVKLRKINPTIDKDKAVCEKIIPVRDRKDVDNNNNMNNKESASVVRDKSEESRRTDSAADGPENIKLLTKESFKLRENSVEKSFISLNSSKGEPKKSFIDCDCSPFAGNIFTKRVDILMRFLIKVSEKRSAVAKEERQESSKFCLLFVMCAILLLGALWWRLHIDKKEAIIVSESGKQNQSFNYEYFDIVKWP